MRDRRQHFASFRDLTGFVFKGADGFIYRQVNTTVENDYRLLMDSGLYRDLSRDGLLIEHLEAPLSYKITPAASLVIRPRLLSFISYPYEWCFSQLRDAALHTLAVQRRALKFGLALRDGSAYNVQFDGTAPIFIDTLSFQPWREGTPWAGYGQFCRHFLAPLGLMSLVDPRMTGLLRADIDGVPLDLAAKLLPSSSRASGNLRKHIVTPALAQPFTLAAHHGLLDSLEEALRSLSPPARTPSAHPILNAGEPAQTISAYLHVLRPQRIWDFSSVSYDFSKLAGELNANFVDFSTDAGAVERRYLEWKSTGDKRSLPLLLDLANPSPGLGWSLSERTSILDRGPADVVLAFDLIHRLALGNGIAPLHIAETLNQLGHHLIVDFAATHDPDLQGLLGTNLTLRKAYTRQDFEDAFAVNFRILEARSYGDAGRTIYLMEATG